MSHFEVLARRYDLLIQTVRNTPKQDGNSFHRKQLVNNVVSKKPRDLKGSEHYVPRYYAHRYLQKMQ